MTEEYTKHGIDLLPNDLFGTTLKSNFHHFVALQKILESTYDEWKGCGSYLMNGSTLNYDIGSYPKQINLFSVSSGVTNVLEIGVHGGHSLLIMLLANPNTVITCIDICEYSHVEKCVHYLNSQFNNQITLIKGSSPEILSKLDTTIFNNLDMVHIDGNHCAQAIEDELEFVKNNATKTLYVIFDDYDSSNIPNLIRKNQMLEILDIPNCPHRNCVTRLHTENLKTF